MPTLVGAVTEDESFVAALEYTGRECHVHYLDEQGGTVAVADAVVLAITQPFVIVLCRGAEVPLMFDRLTLQHAVINDEGDIENPGDYELRGIPNVTLH